MWYLHAPDHTTPYEVTLRTVNELHLEGKFSRFGISNYAAYVHHITYCTKVLMAAQVGSGGDGHDLPSEWMDPAYGLPGNLQRDPP